jgi:hypothetical protein
MAYGIARQRGAYNDVVANSTPLAEPTSRDGSAGTTTGICSHVTHSHNQTLAIHSAIGEGYIGGVAVYMFSAQLFLSVSKPVGSAWTAVVAWLQWAEAVSRPHRTHSLSIWQRCRHTIASNTANRGGACMHLSNRVPIEWRAGEF